MKGHKKTPIRVSDVVSGFLFAVLPRCNAVWRMCGQWQQSISIQQFWNTEFLMWSCPGSFEIDSYVITYLCCSGCGPPWTPRRLFRTVRLLPRCAALRACSYAERIGVSQSVGIRLSAMIACLPVWLPLSFDSSNFCAEKYISWSQ